ncbi:hypothetical protein ES703_58986 [subsurface metagenome]
MTTKDETKGTPGDESKGKGTPKDESKGTPKDKGKLYTVAQIDKLKSDAAAMGQGRAEKVAKQEKDALTSELESMKGRFDALEGQANETRLAEARGDPVKLQAYQRDQAVGKREQVVADKERDLIRREGQVKTDRAEIDKDKGVVSVAYLAAKHGLEVEKLESYGITDPEALEKVAVDLAAAGKPPETEEEKTAREAREAAGEEKLELDSGEGSGSGDPTEQQRLHARYPTMKTK